jgi:ribosome-associated heat shock protein Hsp15
MTAARLDKWLFCARLCRTRETAQGVIAAGKIRLNGARVAKPGHAVRPGDILTVALGGRVAVVKVLALAGRRQAAPLAQGLYQALLD